MTKAKQRILISRCFLGDKVKYNGGDNQLFHQAIAQWQTENRLVPICPEVVGGLGIPRPPAEIKSGMEVITIQGDDVSAQFDKGAKAALLLCQQHEIQFALLKESSPSCGSNTIYDGTFSANKVAGEGVTTALLRKNGIKVYSEKTIESLLEDLSTFEV